MTSTNFQRNIFYSLISLSEKKRVSIIPWLIPYFTLYSNEIKNCSWVCFVDSSCSWIMMDAKMIFFYKICLFCRNTYIFLCHQTWLKIWWCNDKTSLLPWMMQPPPNEMQIFQNGIERHIALKLLCPISWPITL